MDENCPPERRSMPLTNSIELARGWARTLEDKEAKRAGAPLEVIRPVVARRHGVPESKLVSLRKNRLKDIGVALFESLRSGVIRELEAEMRHAEHQIQILRQTGADPRGGEMQSALGRIQTIREALGIEE